MDDTDTNMQLQISLGEENVAALHRAPSSGSITPQDTPSTPDNSEKAKKISRSSRLRAGIKKKLSNNSIFSSDSVDLDSGSEPGTPVSRSSQRSSKSEMVEILQDFLPINYDAVTKTEVPLIDAMNVASLIGILPQVTSNFSLGHSSVTSQSSNAESDCFSSANDTEETVNELVQGLDLKDGTNDSVLEEHTGDPLTFNINMSPVSSCSSAIKDYPSPPECEGKDTVCQKTNWNVDDAIIDGTAQLLHTAGGLFVSFLGHAATSALSLTQNAVEFLINYTSDMETWHDCDTDVDDDDDAFHDAAEDLTPHDRVYHICNELLTTEQVYVERLGILVTAKEKAAKIINPEVASQMFKDIEVIWQFHHDNLLPQLTDRMKKWLQYEKIGDVMRKLAPFLKLYTEYVKDFQRASALVDTYEDKNSQFAAALTEIRENHGNRRNCKLKVQAHMMEPIQRVPRYELLLTDYLKRIPADSPDRTDAEEALKSVAQAATHFEDMIKRDSRIGELMGIQNKLDGNVNIVQANRELIKEGPLEKVRRVNLSDKYVFLFNDMMLICNRLKLVATKYKVKNVLNLSDIRVFRGLNLDAPTSFAIMCPGKEIELVGSSAEETETWFTVIQETLKNNKEKQVTDNNDNSVLSPGTENIERNTQYREVETLWKDNIHISADDGKSWKNRYCSLTSDGKLHVYKDDEEISYLQTGHFEKGLTNMTHNRKGKSVCLTTAFHRYLLNSERDDIVDALFYSLDGRYSPERSMESHRDSSSESLSSDHTNIH